MTKNSPQAGAITRTSFEGLKRLSSPTNPTFATRKHCSGRLPVRVGGSTSVLRGAGALPFCNAVPEGV